MSYLTEEKKVATISLKKIDFDTPPEEARGINREILDFFEKNPDGEVKLEFGGYARLSQNFADALFEDNRLKKHLAKISTWGIHVFDEQILSSALQKG